MVTHHYTVSFQDFLSERNALQTAFKTARKTRKVSKGSLIVGQDETDQDMYFLRMGQAKVVIYSEGGNEIQLAEFSAGTLFGEMAVLLTSSRSSNVVAQTDCELDVISANAFNALMEEFPELAIFMTHMLAKRLQDTSQNLFENLAFTVPQRVYETLLRRSKQSSADAEIYHLSPTPSVTSLSETLNVSREATSRAITKLTSQGLVKKQHSHWEILRPSFHDY